MLRRHVKYSPRLAKRSTLPKDEARRRYVEIGELVALEQIRKDAKLLDERRSRSARSPASTPTPSPPATARRAARSPTCSAARPPSRPRRWRWRSTRASGSSGSSSPPRRLSRRRGLVRRRASPASRRAGPRTAPSRPSTTGSCGRCGSAPCPTASGASSVPGPSMEEYVQWLRRLEAILGDALDHFGLTLREGRRSTTSPARSRA